MAWDIASQLINNQTLTASGQSTAIDPEGVAGPVSGVVEFRLYVKVVTGTNPTLDVYVEESADNSAWTEVCKFSQNVSGSALITATKTTTDPYQAVGVFRKRYKRARWVIGGTANPTFNNVSLYSRGIGAMVSTLPSAT